MIELDARALLLDSLLTTPRRDFQTLLPIHLEIIEQDPLFYAHLAIWYFEHGFVRDHKEIFVAMLCVSRILGHRELGLNLLHKLPPYQLARVVDLIKGKTIKNPIPRDRFTYIRPQRLLLASRPLSIVQQVTHRLRSHWTRERQIPDEFRHIIPKPANRSGFVVGSVGLRTNIPRSMRSEIRRYLRKREADATTFDRTALGSKRALKRLYAGLHIRPSKRAQAVLFDNKPPPGSLAAIAKQIAHSADPTMQARAIAQHRIPYRVAVSMISAMTPKILDALIEIMSPQELINNIHSLKRRGAFDHPALRTKIEGKLDAARHDRRVSPYKAKVASIAAGAEGRLRSMLENVTEHQVKSAARITKPTALLIDKSGSMLESMTVGTHLGAMISSVCQAEFYAYAFDAIAYPIEPDGPHLFQWERALSGFRAGGGTSCGIALEFMRRAGQRVEQIVMITDENENRGPFFGHAYMAYAEQFRIRPAVIFLKIGRSSHRLEVVCARLGIAPQVINFRSDYYALPNVLPMLSFPSLTDMVMQIMGHGLPEITAVEPAALPFLS
jgi:hypothetical protein